MTPLWVMDLNGVNKLIGSVWQLEDSAMVTLRLFCAQNPTPGELPWQLDLKGPKHDEFSYARARFNRPSPIRIVEFRLGELREVCRQVTQKAGFALGRFATVGFDLDGKTLNVECCGRRWPLVGKKVE